MTITRRSAPDLQRLVLAGALLAAGLIHVVLTPDHFGESTLMGLGFAGAAIAEIGLAGMVLARPARRVYGATVVVALALVALYAYNVTVGLPFASAHSEAAEHPAASVEHADDHGDEHAETLGSVAGGEQEADHLDGDDPRTGGTHDHGAEGLQLGAGEPVDAIGASTKALELLSVALALLLWRRS